MPDPIEGTQMFAEAAESAKVVRLQRAQNASAVSRLAGAFRNSPPSVVATCARGSSDHAATYARYMIETRLGLLTSSQSPSIASVYGIAPRAPGVLGIAISQSGKSPDLLASVTRLQEGGAQILALVNDAASPLARLAREVIPLRAGSERSVAATKSYIATLFAIADLVARWSEDPVLMAALDKAPAQLERAWCADWTPLVEGLRTCRGLFVIGRGLGLGIAQEAALKFKETCGLHAEAFSAAELRHGPMALIGPDFPLLVFCQSDETREGIDTLIADAIARGAPVFVTGSTTRGAISLPSEKAHAAVEPLVQIQAFYRAVNALAIARGCNPDAPPALAKITKTV